MSAVEGTFQPRVHQKFLTPPAFTTSHRLPSDSTQPTVQDGEQGRTPRALYGAH
jgi:hypothetical protein